MAKRPELSLQLQADVERKRKAIFDTAIETYPLLFYAGKAVTSPIFAALRAELAASILAETTYVPGNVPAQRLGASVRLQIQEYSIALLDAEAELRSTQTRDLTVLRSWLEEIALEVESEVLPIASNCGLDVHCALDERVKALQDGLTARVQHWIDTRQVWLESRRRAPEPPIEPVTGRTIHSPSPISTPTVEPVAPPDGERAASTRLPGYVESLTAAKKLELHLRASGIKQTDFAKSVGCDERTLRRFRRTGKARRDIVVEIAKQMSVTIDQLLSNQ